MSTCNWLDLQTLGSQPIMPKNCSRVEKIEIRRIVQKLGDFISS